MIDPTDRDGGETPKRGRKPLDAHVRLDKPARIRFSSNDLRIIGEAMAIVTRKTGRTPVFSTWLRGAAIEYAQFQIHQDKIKP